SGASSRWLRSPSDDTTGRRRGTRSGTPAGVPAAFFRFYNWWCRIAQKAGNGVEMSVERVEEVSLLADQSIKKKALGKSPEALVSE
ncbi:MAG: hypothetical protein WCJ40_18440, partial [Planctomycetota bacterium]